MNVFVNVVFFFNEYIQFNKTKKLLSADIGKQKNKKNKVHFIGP